LTKEKTQKEKEAEFRKKFHERYDARADVVKVIKYLDLNLENPNIGTRNKQRLMERALAYMKKWRTGTHDDWINRLSLRLNLTVRTVRENYVDPLISEGIIHKTGSQLVFVGIPDEGIQ
jgi:hypothetical protein